MSRGSRMARQWRILQQLSATPAGLTAAELAEQAACHKRTIYRDLDALQQAGFPLYQAEAADPARRWAIIGAGRRDALPFPLEMPELMALYLSRDILKILKETFIYDNLDALFQKIRAMLPAEALRFLREVEDNLYVKERPYKQYKKNLTRRMESINTAIVANRVIDITYFTMSRQQESRRRLHPYSFWYFDGSFYLIAFCTLRQEVRIFAMDRIRALSVTEETFCRPPDFSAAAFMRGSFGVFQGRTTRVKILFAPEVAGYIKEKKWHESQRLTEKRNGAVCFEADVAGIREIKFWVLGWGARARVLAPASLKREVAAEIAAMDRQY